MPPVALLTDFGPSEYAGVMKGVILGLLPGAQLVDITHDISPQNVREGAWVLLGSYRWFPKGTVFLCVVDPGVGTGRRAIAVRSQNYFFVGPDNGLVSAAAAEDGIVEARAVGIPPGASNTFHGRDVFAPAAALIASGGWERLGTPIERIEMIDFHLRGREGEVVRVDRFGNCITNLPPIDGRREYAARSERGSLPGRLPFFRTYAEAPGGELFVIENAYGTLEIALKNGSASRIARLAPGERIVLE